MIKLPFPAAALHSHVAILGKTGSGKSNTAKVIAEYLMRAKERVCYVDPTGTAWGLRMDAAGEKPSQFKPVIFVIIAFGFVWLVVALASLLMQDHWWSRLGALNMLVEFLYVWFRAETQGVER